MCSSFGARGPKYLVNIIHWEVDMNYNEFLTYLFDRDQTKELAVELGVAVDSALFAAHSRIISVPA